MRGITILIWMGGKGRTTLIHTLAHPTHTITIKAFITFLIEPPWLEQWAVQWTDGQMDKDYYTVACPHLKRSKMYNDVLWSIFFLLNSFSAFNFFIKFFFSLVWPAYTFSSQHLHIWNKRQDSIHGISLFPNFYNAISPWLKLLNFYQKSLPTQLPCLKNNNYV